MINNLTVLRTTKRNSSTFTVPHYLNRILKVLFVFLIPGIILLVGSLVLAKPAKLSQTDAVVSKDAISQNTILSAVSENQTKIESVEVKPEVLPSALNDENSEISRDKPKTDDVTEVSYRPDPIYDPVGAELERIIAGDTSAYVQNASADLAQIDPNRYTVDPLEQLAELNGDDSLLNRLDPTRQNNPTGQPQSAANYQPANQAVNTVQYHYNGDGHLVGKTVDGVRTDFALDIAGGLPEVIYTSAGNSYLHLPGVIMTENAAGEVRYLLMDGLGSVRQVVDEAGNVVTSYEFDPYGNPVQTSGGAPYGYTGEWWEDEVGLLHLRARWYDPGTGTFLSKDPWLGDPMRPQTLNGHNYVEGNPVNRRDSSGLNSEPKIPDQAQWTMAGGLGWEHSYTALDRLVRYREHVVAAAQRHGFAPIKICQANPAQNELTYALSSIVYRESLGHDEEGPAQAWADLFGTNFSIGIGQMRPNTTGREVEEAGLLYNPGTMDNPLTTATPYQPQPTIEDQIAYFLGGETQSKNRVMRMMDPMWAIEYTAGNMDLARRQSAFYSNPQYPGLGRPMTEWEKMAAWYNTGVINLEDVPEINRNTFWKSRLEPYLVGTYKAKTAIQNLDLLGVRSKCDGSCYSLPVILK